MTSRSDVDAHPAFLAAAEDVQWPGEDRGALWRDLSRQAYRAQGDRWVWRILPAGLIVAVMLREPGRKMIRFWLEGDPGSAFLAACERFLLACELFSGEWVLIDQGTGTAPDGREDVSYAWYQQSFKLHDIEAQCEECGAIVLKDERADRQLCVRCRPKAAGTPQEELSL